MSKPKTVILGCPFCGKKPVIHATHDWSVYCLCSVRKPGDRHTHAMVILRTRAAAIRAWNRRAERKEYEV